MSLPSIYIPTPFPVGLANRLINGEMLLAPSGAQTLGDGDDAFLVYTVLTQSGDVEVSQLVSPEPGQARAMRIEQAHASAQRFAISQSILSTNTTDLRSANLNIGFRARLSVNGRTRFALLQWAGTADSQPADVINDWTSGQYIPGQFFISTVTVVNSGVLSADMQTWASAPYIPYQVSASANNLIFIVWTEDAQAEGVTLDIGLIQVAEGTQLLQFEHRPYIVDALIAGLLPPSPIVPGQSTFVGPDGTPQFGIGWVADSELFYQVQGALDGSGPVMAVVTDNPLITDADAFFAALGEGACRFGNGNGDLFAAIDSGGVTTSTLTAQAATASAYVILGVESSETNKGLSVTPKGTGPLTGQSPTNSAAGGNARGVYATDWQRIRADASQVASGDYAAIVGGNGNTASGATSVSGGNANRSTGSHSTTFGNACIASGFATSAIGNGCEASADYARASGRNAYGNGQGKDAWSSSGFSAVVGSNQGARQTLQASTTNATVTSMSADGAAVNTGNSIPLQNNSVMLVDAVVTAKNEGGTEFAAYSVRAVISRGANAAATVVESVTTDVWFEDTAGWDVTLIADTTNGCGVIRVTGAAATNIRWGATVYTHEVVYS